MSKEDGLDHDDIIVPEQTETFVYAAAGGVAFRRKQLDSDCQNGSSPVIILIPYSCLEDLILRLQTIRQSVDDDA